MSHDTPCEMSADGASLVRFEPLTMLLAAALQCCVTVLGDRRPSSDMRRAMFGTATLCRAGLLPWDDTQQAYVVDVDVAPVIVGDLFVRSGGERYFMDENAALYRLPVECDTILDFLARYPSPKLRAPFEIGPYDS